MADSIQHLIASCLDNGGHIGNQNGRRILTILTKIAFLAPLYSK
jgi:hypothetical protein